MMIALRNNDIVTFPDKLETNKSDLHLYEGIAKWELILYELEFFFWLFILLKLMIKPALLYMTTDSR